MIAAYPAYQLVRQEFVPSDLDEAEFEMTITAPEGTSAAAMDDIIRAIETDVRSVPGFQASRSVGGLPRRVTKGRHTFA